MNSSPILSRRISQKVLTIGPDYKNHRGGIGSVIETYSAYYEKFQFIASYKVGSLFYKTYIFIRCVFSLFLQLVFNRNIRVVHIHGASYGSFYRKFILFLIAKFVFGKKVIYHIHGAEYHLFYSRSNLLIKKLITVFISRTDCVICLSERWKKYFKTIITTKRIEIVYNIVDYPIKSIIDKDRSILTFLFLGMICKRKGIFDLLEVISSDKEKYYGKIKLIIGGNGEVNKLQDIINKKHLNRIVEFVGWISHKEKANWLQKADIFILPSFNEGLPVAILEAMSYGQAIISTNVGGIPEIVIPEENGILIEPGNLIEIKAAIDFFIEHKEKAIQFGQESLHKVKKHLPDSVIPKLATIYESLLNDK
jgi:glycosyltransferase involved in cell wall biosynthesis